MRKLRLCSPIVLVLWMVSGGAALSGACQPELPPVANCQPLATRCDQRLAQVCSPSQRWITAQDCQPLGPGWRCCLAADQEGRYSCQPLADCLSEDHNDAGVR
jgi:hypothetical protein